MYSEKSCIVFGVDIWMKLVHILQAYKTIWMSSKKELVINILMDLSEVVLTKLN